MNTGTTETINRKMPVTVNISTGAISAKSFTPAEMWDFAASRSSSCAGKRAIFWASACAGSESSFGSNYHESKEKISNNILTPGSIPQFTIPSLHHAIVDEEEQSRDTGNPEVDHRCLSLSITSSLPSSASSCFGSTPELKAHRTISEPFTHNHSTLHREGSYCCQFLEAEHWPDPTTKAALSLPHLAKVTTPYGFVTLTQSPQMADEETLLYQAGQRRLHRDEGSINHGTCAIDSKPNAFRKSSTVQCLSRQFSTSQTGEAPREKERMSSTCASSSNTTLKHHTVVKRK